MRKLGSEQKDFLHSMKNHGSFMVNGGWIWGSASRSLRLAESLLKRGLLKKETRSYTKRPGTYDVYLLTEAGIAAEKES